MICLVWMFEKPINRELTIVMESLKGPTTGFSGSPQIACMFV